MRWWKASQQNYTVLLELSHIEAQGESATATTIEPFVKHVFSVWSKTTLPEVHSAGIGMCMILWGSALHVAENEYVPI